MCVFDKILIILNNRFNCSKLFVNLFLKNRFNMNVFLRYNFWIIADIVQFVSWIRDVYYLALSKEQSF